MDEQTIYQAPSSQLETATDKTEIEKVLTIAKRQKALLLCFLIYLIFGGLSGAAGPEFQPTVQLAALPMLIVFATFTGRLALRVYGKFLAIILIILSFLPLINLLVLLAVNARANSVIKKSGFRVGLLGANTKVIQASLA